MDKNISAIFASKTKVERRALIHYACNDDYCTGLAKYRMCLQLLRLLQQNIEYDETLAIKALFSLLAEGNLFNISLFSSLRFQRAPFTTALVARKTAFTVLLLLGLLA